MRHYLRNFEESDETTMLLADVVRPYKEWPIDMRGTSSIIPRG